MPALALGYGSTFNGVFTPRCLGADALQAIRLVACQSPTPRIKLNCLIGRLPLVKAQKYLLSAQSPK